MWLVVTRVASTVPKAQNSLPIPRGASGQTRQMFAIPRSSPKTAREKEASTWRSCRHVWVTRPDSDTWTLPHEVTPPISVPPLSWILRVTNWNVYSCQRRWGEEGQTHFWWKFWALYPAGQGAGPLLLSIVCAMAVANAGPKWHFHHMIQEKPKIMTYAVKQFGVSMSAAFFFFMLCRPREASLGARVGSLNYKFTTRTPLSLLCQSLCYRSCPCVYDPHFHPLSSFFLKAQKGPQGTKSYSSIIPRT